MELIAVVVLGQDVERVRGSVPIFVTADEAELARVTLYLSKIFKAMVHDLENGVYLIVKH